MKICYHNGDLILLEKYIKIRLYHENSIINGFFFKGTVSRYCACTKL